MYSVLHLILFCHAAHDDQANHQPNGENAADLQSGAKIIARQLGHIAHYAGAECTAKVASHGQQCKQGRAAKGHPGGGDAEGSLAT